MSAADFYASMNARLGLEHGQALKVLNAALDLLTHNGTQVPCTSSPELWNGATKADRDTATRGCRQCPLIRECLDVGKHEEYGIWGGRLAGRAKATQAVLEGFD